MITVNCRANTHPLKLTFLLVETSHTKLLFRLNSHDAALEALRLAFETELCVFEVEALVAFDAYIIFVFLRLCFVRAHDAVPDHSIDFSSTCLTACVALLALLELFHLALFFNQCSNLTFCICILLLACYAVGHIWVCPVFHYVDQSAELTTPLVLLQWNFNFRRSWHRNR